MDNDTSETGGSRGSGEEPGGTLFGVRCSRVVLALLVLILIASLGIRLYRIDSPSDFHVIRQYRSDILARAYYFELSDDIPEWRRDVAGMSRDNRPLLEPPVTEYLAAGAYYLVGGEHRWIPRVFSSLFWLAGGVMLFFRSHVVLHWQKIRPLLGRRNSRILLSLSPLRRSRQPELPARPVDDHADAGEPAADPALR